MQSCLNNRYLLRIYLRAVIAIVPVRALLYTLWHHVEYTWIDYEFYSNVRLAVKPRVYGRTISFLPIIRFFMFKIRQSESIYVLPKEFVSCPSSFRLSWFLPPPLHPSSSVLNFARQRGTASGLLCRWTSSEGALKISARGELVILDMFSSWEVNIIQGLKKYFMSSSWVNKLWSLFFKASQSQEKKRNKNVCLQASTWLWKCIARSNYSLINDIVAMGISQDPLISLAIKNIYWGSFKNLKCKCWGNFIHIYLYMSGV